MTFQVHVSHAYDMYVVSIRDNTIVRVEKFLGDTQMPREVKYDDLPTEVQDKIIDKIITKTADEET